MSSPTTDPGFTTDATAAVFGPARRVAAMCRFEVALARASVAAGVLPAGVGDRLVAACEAGVDDPDAVLAEGWEDGTPVVPLLRRLRRSLDGEASEWLHHGATTQDVVDSATMLQLQEALGAVRADLVRLAGDLRGLAVTHRDAPAAAWTFLQPAVPTTVGRRIAGWLAPVVAHLGELREVVAALPVQLGGPSGTLDALGRAGPGVVDGVAADLGLAVPLLPWHTDRTPVTRVVGLLARVARTVGTIATDLALLAHDGAVTMRAGGSSSMPGKRNPIDATRAVAAAEACLGVATVVTAGRPHELERGVGGWHAEWFAVPLAVQSCAAAVEAVERAVATCEVVTGGGTTGPTPSTGVFVDRVVAACDEELGR